MVSIGPYSDILEGRKGKVKQSTQHAFFKKEKILNQGLHQRSQISALHHGQWDWCSGLTVWFTECSGLNFEHIEVKCTTFKFFYFMKCSFFCHI
jgi:hypothetical protein